MGHVRNVPVGMLDGRAIVDWNGGGVSVKTKLTRALRQVLNSYLGSEFLRAQVGAERYSVPLNLSCYITQRQ